MLRLVIQPVMFLCGVLHFSNAFVFGIIDVTLALHLQQVAYDVMTSRKELLALMFLSSSTLASF